MPYKDKERQREYFRQYDAKRRGTRIEYERAKSRAWYKLNREHHIQMKLIDYKFNKQAWRNRELKRLYGITVVQYEDLFRQQQGRCAICGKEESTRALDVDHDHETGKIRGLLCKKCNVALGLLNNQETLLSAISYLRRGSL